MLLVALVAIAILIYVLVEQLIFPSGMFWGNVNDTGGGYKPWNGSIPPGPGANLTWKNIDVYWAEADGDNCRYYKQPYKCLVPGCYEPTSLGDATYTTFFAKICMGSTYVTKVAPSPKADAHKQWQYVNGSWVQVPYCCSDPGTTTHVKSVCIPEFDDCMVYKPPRACVPGEGCKETTTTTIMTMNPSSSTTNTMTYPPSSISIPSSTTTTIKMLVTSSTLK